MGAMRLAMVGGMLVLGACGAATDESATQGSTPAVTTQGTADSTSSTSTSATAITTTVAPTSTGPTTTLAPSTTVTTTSTAPNTTVTTTTTTTTTSAPTTTLPAAKTWSIDLVNFNIQPGTITVRVGDTVRWTNAQGAHTTSSGKGGGAYGKMANGILDSSPKERHSR